MQQPILQQQAKTAEELLDEKARKWQTLNNKRFGERKKSIFYQSSMVTRGAPSSIRDAS